jgi:hypothetical protein
MVALDEPAVVSPMDFASPGDYSEQLVSRNSWLRAVCPPVFGIKARINANRQSPIANCRWPMAGAGGVQNGGTVGGRLFGREREEGFLVVGRCGRDVKDARDEVDAEFPEF